MSGRSSDNNSSNEGNPSGFSKGFSFAAISDVSKRLAAPADDDDDEDDRMDDSESVGWYPSNRTEEEIANVVYERRGYKLSDRRRRYTIDRIGGLDGLLTSVWNTITAPIEQAESCRIRPKKGLILHGPKGVGKTMIMEELAERCNRYSPKMSAFFCCTFLHIGSQVENDLVQVFNTAKQLRPSVIFLEYFERLAAFRGPHVRTLKSLMDELDDNGSVFVVAATKHLDKVDPEIRKAGRFDTDIRIELPNLEARKDILYKMSSNRHLLASVIDAVANETAGFNGSELWDLWYAAYKIGRNRTDFKRMELEDFKEALCAINSKKQPQPNIIGIAGNADKS